MRDRGTHVLHIAACAVDGVAGRQEKSGQRKGEKGDHLEFGFGFHGLIESEG